MFAEKKKKALTEWLQLARNPEPQMSIEEQYDELLKMADEMEEARLVSAREWRQLIRDAGTIFDYERDRLESEMK
ncbi:hypothetical protein DXT77_28685 [Pseudomonas sp. 91RF]|jgi:hypothetical protein|uniref:hypothetical protein n=1 Tax=Pseudomonas sp. 91RF TaxID=2292261 RepID=UPI000E65FA14|nr:hypothetical protein [Pseudomonas sp. 91RF]RIJ06650.1 hypothetical protein DXT77_28685 [Pseudomonas sp. 91RF]